MLINSIILAISSSIDSFGIGITYGIKDTKISNAGKIILFSISFFITVLSLYFGDWLKNILPSFFTKFIGSIILVFMGIFICFQALKKDSEKVYNTTQKESKKIYRFFIKFLGITIEIIKNPISSDLDNSKLIDSKEALFLSFALSLDCFCIGIGGSIIGINYLLFPFFIASFQLLFLSLGNFFGRTLHKLNNLPDNIWSIISGTILVFIGFLRFFI